MWKRHIYQEKKLERFFPVLRISKTVNNNCGDKTQEVCLVAGITIYRLRGNGIGLDDLIFSSMLQGV